MDGIAGCYFAYLAGKGTVLLKFPERIFFMYRFLFTLVLFSVVVLSGGCDNKRKYVWYQPGVTEGQISYDCRECLKKAKGWHTKGVDDAIRDAKLSGKHFIVYKDKRFPMDNDDFMNRQTYHIGACMKAKGYKWKLIDF